VPRGARRDPSKIMKQSYMMRGTDINYVTALARYLGIAQSEALHIIIDRIRNEKKFLDEMKEAVEKTREKQLRELGIEETKEPHRDERKQQKNVAKYVDF
jgi:hypothetical protein